MDELVALSVQVDALRGHVTGHKNAHRGVRLAEILDDLLLLDVRQASMHDAHRLLREPQVRSQMLRQPGQCRNALGEDDDTLGGPRPDPDAGQLGEQGPVLARVGGVRPSREGAQAGQRPGLLRGGQVLFTGCPLPASVDTLVDRLDERRG